EWMSREACSISRAAAKSRTMLSSSSRIQRSNVSGLISTSLSARSARSRRRRSRARSMTSLSMIVETLTTASALRRGGVGWGARHRRPDDFDPKTAGLLSLEGQLPAAPTADLAGDGEAEPATGGIALAGL